MEKFERKQNKNEKLITNASFDRSENFVNKNLLTNTNKTNECEIRREQPTNENTMVHTNKMIKSLQYI